MEMSEDRFWNLVEQVNWKENAHKDLSEMQMPLMKELSVEEGEAMRRACRKVSRQVRKAVREYCEENDTRLGVGDDSFSDLCYHVVGLGKETFEDEVANPEKIYNRGKSGDYVESFIYVIPTDWDYEAVRIETYQERAKHLIEAYSDILEDWKFSKEYKADWETIFGILGYIVEGDVGEFMKHEDRATKLATKVEKPSLFNRLYKDLKAYYIPMEQ